MKASVAFVLGCLALFCATACEERQPPGNTGEDVVGEQPAQNGKAMIHLYFTDVENAYLTAEDRVV
ncbi:MAG: hypothetical protein N2F24_04435, partial [Deltaproteobacteria bacterium]